jgi:hypothetical protein
MKRVLLILILLLAACSSLSAGHVVERKFHPAYDWLWMMPIYSGQTCIQSGTTQVCTPRYTYIPMVMHEPDSWSITIEGQVRYNQDPERRTLGVTEETYDSIEIGDWYEVPGDE